MSRVKRTSSFACLRCGHQYEEADDPSQVRELTCPSCGSNSVRRIRRPAAKREKK